MSLGFFTFWAVESLTRAWHRPELCSTFRSCRVWRKRVKKADSGQYVSFDAAIRADGIL
ncbi:unnamed protein product [Periconia digitata]|uniref:Uncharacterized protein n=1 Tax=Periconia digitata TaxID=1303443 RepID=A0A9W4U3H4_9PLEO|nr:unnamed protein product [Periconia digitata]